MPRNDKRLNIEQTFPTEEQEDDAAFVARFIQHVSKTGDPTTLSDLSITRPPDGAEFFWKTGEIIVPVHKSERGELVVCPWCSPTKPKFKRGRLCRFPNEGVYRFVGWRCAKTHLDTASMREADKRWAAEQKQIICNSFLRFNCIGVERLLERALFFNESAGLCLPMT